MWLIIVLSFLLLNDLSIDRLSKSESIHNNKAKIDNYVFNISDFNYYIDKDVGIFLHDELKKEFSREIWLSEPPGVLIGKGYSFDKDNIYIKVYIHFPKFLKQFNPKMNWSNELFKREKIKRITIYKDNREVSTFCK